MRCTRLTDCEAPPNVVQPSEVLQLNSGVETAANDSKRIFYEYLLTVEFKTAIYVQTVEGRIARRLLNYIFDMDFFMQAEMDDNKLISGV